MNVSNNAYTQKPKAPQKQIWQPTSQDIFYQLRNNHINLVMQGNQEYVDVIKSKKYVNWCCLELPLS